MNVDNFHDRMLVVLTFPLSDATANVLRESIVPCSSKRAGALVWRVDRLTISMAVKVSRKHMNSSESSARHRKPVSGIHIDYWACERQHDVR